MKVLKPFRVTGILLVLCILLHLYSLNTQLVERYYSQVFFPKLAGVFRFLLGWIPLSVGDLVYLIAAILIVWKAFRFIRHRFRRQPIYWKCFFQRLINFCLLIYLVFNICWGLNYNRTPVMEQLGIEVKKPEKEELLQLNHLLVNKVNAEKEEALRNGSIYRNKKRMFKAVHAAYLTHASKLSFSHYRHASIKPALFSIPGNYLGFTGYYNPFTGEAQVNTTIPDFLQPFTAAHEIGHQLGYAKEMEANFVGFLVAENSTDPILRYSAYLDMFLYANRNLHRADSTLAKEFRERLSLSVREDIEIWRRFSKKHDSFLQPLFQHVYGFFLQRNQQPQGIWSYDEVTTFLVAWYKNNGQLQPNSVD